MRSERLRIRGATLLWPDVHADDRGNFHRVVETIDLASMGLDPTIRQVSIANNRRKGTLRGMHYQAEPHSEAKTVWCHAGSVYDVLIDLRTSEPTYGEWISVVLAAAQPVALHVPHGVAHGYQTLEDDSALTYLISTPYVAESARVMHWQDPTIGIDWPLSVTSISERDDKAPSWPTSH